MSPNDQEERRRRQAAAGGLRSRGPRAGAEPSHAVTQGAFLASSVLLFPVRSSSEGVTAKGERFDQEKAAELCWARASGSMRLPVLLWGPEAGPAAFGEAPESGPRPLT